jgi:hypothetical protein
VAVGSSVGGTVAVGEVVAVGSGVCVGSAVVAVAAGRVGVGEATLVVAVGLVSAAGGADGVMVGSAAVAVGSSLLSGPEHAAATPVNSATTSSRRIHRASIEGDSTGHAPVRCIMQHLHVDDTDYL